jgi:catechol 2,3-dioxygenase-like lactoylglutathione lyase family enzyme
MSSPQLVQAEATPAVATVDLKLEVVVIPVADVERSKRFYEGLGWRVDGDFRNGPDWRAVQMTPPGSPCSIHFGTGISAAAPGSVKNLYLAVSNMAAARAELIGRGVEVSEPFHFTSIGGAPQPGPHPEGRSYSTYAAFSDPDGNSWLLQEITTRLPGRGFSSLDVATLTELLKDAENGHGRYEPTAPKHHWSDWYAAYIVARQEGRTSEEAAAAGTTRVDAILQRDRS